MHNVRTKRESNYPMLRKLVGGMIVFLTITSYSSPNQLNSKLELLWDYENIADTNNVSLKLHPPKLREVAIVHDAPWEGNVCCYHTVFQDGSLYRMYYRGASINLQGFSHSEYTCYAESSDGITWHKPNLGIIDFAGNSSNNIVWSGLGSHNFSPFKDSNPECPPDQRYKALGGDSKGLLAFKSADGIHWQKLHNDRVITKGAFDSQNIAFWDSERGLYVDYHRQFINQIRGIMTCTSSDFINWSEPVWLSYDSNTLDEQLYTNAIQPYPRAPQIYIGFPKRLLPDRTTIYDKSGAGGLSDGVFMSSRDGLNFTRWTEAFLRPGLQKERWINRNNMIAWGVVETKPEFVNTWPELSLFSTENYYGDSPNRLRRMTMRLDGFVSINAKSSGGSFSTKPLIFAATTNPTPPPNNLPYGNYIVKTNVLYGHAALLVNEPLAVELPGTANLGTKVTFAIGFSKMTPGHRRVFSAYAGGANTVGTKKVIFDLMAGSAFSDGSAVRFWYDGTTVAIPANTMQNWSSISLERVHLAATYDDGVVTIYVNGTKRAQGGTTGKGTLSPALGNIRFGEDYPPASLINEPFLGLADDLTIIDRVLTASEILTAFNDGMTTVINKASDNGVFFNMESTQGNTLSNLLENGVSHITLPNSSGWGDTMLLLNASTSAFGSIRCAIQGENGEAIPGFSLDDCRLLYGDDIELCMRWKNGSDVTSLADKPICLYFELKDADIFAYRFGQPRLSTKQTNAGRRTLVLVSQQ